MNFVMKVRTGRNARVSNRAYCVALRNKLSFFNSDCAQVAVACIYSVLVLDDDVVSKTCVESDRNNLTVGSCNNRVSASPCREVQTFMNVPLSGNRVDVLAERH